MLVALMSVVALSMTLISCGDDDDELTPGGGKSIVGTWRSVIIDDGYYWQLVLKKDGTCGEGECLKQNGKLVYYEEFKGKYDFDGKTLYLYEYDECGEYYEEEYQVTINGNKMILDDGDEKEVYYRQ